jgi:hypothetical protein
VTIGRTSDSTYHASFGASLLGLEKDGFGVLATRAGLCSSRELQRKRNKVSQQSLSDDKRVPKKTPDTRAPTAVSNLYTSSSHGRLQTARRQVIIPESQSMCQPAK